MMSSKKGGHIALLLSVSLSVSQFTLFPFIFFALVAHTEMKFGIQIYLVEGLFLVR
jgi:hypothetical protein